MGLPARKRPTYEDILKLGDDVHAEIIAGELVVHLGPVAEHGAMAAGLTAEIYNAFFRGRGGPGGWWILIEVDVELPGGEWYRPDLIGYRRDRLPEFPRGRPLRERPDWVCEVLSASTVRHDKGPKREGWQRWGVPHLWLADPMERSITVLTWHEAGYLLSTVAVEGAPVRLAPFDAIELSLEEILPPAPGAG
jgi:Uma2 family endonuclease